MEFENQNEQILRSKWAHFAKRGLDTLRNGENRRTDGQNFVSQLKNRRLYGILFRDIKRMPRPPDRLLQEK
jgi:hypothetical protein